MKRELRTLADTRFDLLVVGAGIYGAAIAWDAVQRGLSVAIIDRSDFGGGTSANSMKTVHGGVRSLQSGNPAELRAFVRERRALSLIAPHLIHPLPFVIPTYGGLTRHHSRCRPRSRSTTFFPATGTTSQTPPNISHQVAASRVTSA